MPEALPTAAAIEAMNAAPLGATRAVEAPETKEPFGEIAAFFDKHWGY